MTKYYFKAGQAEEKHKSIYVFETHFDFIKAF